MSTFLISTRRDHSWQPSSLILVLAFWLGTVGNLPLWRTLANLPEMNSTRPIMGGVGLWLAIVALLFATLSWLAWPRWLKPVGWLLLLVSTSSSYFMFTYGIVIDASMMANLLNTDVREARDLLAPNMLLALLLGVVLPGWWWQRQTLRPAKGRSTWWRPLLAGLLGLLVAAIALALSFQDLASLMRNHRSLRFMINPYNTVYALSYHAMTQGQRAQEPLQPIGTDARLFTTPSNAAQAPLVVVVVGETARAANFGLGGYARPTTPQLQVLQQQGELVYFSQVQSCGTNTETSVPCMFSSLGREAYVNSSARHENLLDVLQRAGLAVLWLDNQSGCKGVCERIPHVQISTLLGAATCPDSECPDQALLDVLPTQWAALPAERRALGSVVVMHQMGSHGPAYYKRSPARLKAFQPECTSPSLPSCTTQDIVNAYDNSLRATDEFLAHTIEWLKTQNRPTALLYVSDHGESLGEKGLYLHGMPYRVAPSEQTHVPMLMWFSSPAQRGWTFERACWQQQAQRPWSHDNLFHTMLTLTQVQTEALKPNLSILAPCLSGR